MKHAQFDANGVSLHVVEAGDGPVVLFVHGFPDTWRGWRRQMNAVVEAGYRAVSLDMRGYGQGDKPDDALAYTVFQCVGDLVAVLDALSIEQAILVGHDFGAAVSWSAAIMRSDRFRAVFCLSVPPLLPSRPNMLQRLRDAGQSDFYMFRQMRAEADTEWADAAATIPGMYYWTSGEAPEATRWDPLDPARGLNRPSPVGLPDFVNAEDAAAAIAEFQQFGFHGPLNYYRAIEPYFDEAGAFAGAAIRQPAFFAFGAEDGMVRMRDIDEKNVRKAVPDLKGFERIPGIGHWPQLEATDQVNQMLVGFLRDTRTSAQ